jgi:hypothetical protein
MTEDTNQLGQPIGFPVRARGHHAFPRAVSTETNYTRFSRERSRLATALLFPLPTRRPADQLHWRPWLTTATLRVGSKDLVDTGFSRLNFGTAKSRRLASESSSAVIGRGHLRIVGALLDLRGQANLG